MPEWVYFGVGDWYSQRPALSLDCLVLEKSLLVPTCPFNPHRRKIPYIDFQHSSYFYSQGLRGEFTKEKSSNCTFRVKNCTTSSLSHQPTIIWGLRGPEAKTFVCVIDLQNKSKSWKQWWVNSWVRSASLKAVDITSLICFGPVVAKDLHSRRQLIQFLA